MDIDEATDPGAGDPMGVGYDDAQPDAAYPDDYDLGVDDEPTDIEDLEEVEIGGRKHLLPKALKGGFLMQADYTRKTQELAEQRRELDAERQALQDRQADSVERRKLADIDDLVRQFEQVDWQAAAKSDPEQAKAALAQFESMVETRQTLAAQVSAREEAERLQLQSEHRLRLERGMAELARDIPEWSAPLAKTMASFAQSEFGFTPEEVGEVADPRLIKLLHRAYRGAAGEARVARISAGQGTAPAPTLRGGQGRFHASSNTDDFAAFERLAEAKLKAR